MKHSLVATLLLLFLTVLICFQSCNHAKQGACGEDNVSSYGADNSHNFGENCMNCHKPSGNGSGCFKIAGSVKDSISSSSSSNVTVRLYTGANGTGTLKATVDGDLLGNFYSTDNVDFNSSLYAAVTSSDGKTSFMTSSITNGECNRCHGVSQDIIWTK